MNMKIDIGVETKLVLIKQNYLCFKKKYIYTYPKNEGYSEPRKCDNKINTVSMQRYQRISVKPSLQFFFTNHKG